MAGIITYPHFFSPTTIPLPALKWLLLHFAFFSVWFIFAVPSFLPFQKVMHTRKRHSELYHELNHSSKFHTIDRYNRDPAMSTFKVRPLPKVEWGSTVPMHLPLLPCSVTVTKSHPFITNQSKLCSILYK